MHKIEVYLKSGHTIYIECESFEMTYNSLLHTYIGYSFKGLKVPKKLGFNPAEMVGWIEKE